MTHHTTLQQNLASLKLKMDFLKKYSDSDSEDDSKQIMEPHPGPTAAGSKVKKITDGDAESDVQSVDMSLSEDEESIEGGTPKQPLRSRKDSETDRVAVKPTPEKNKDEKSGGRSYRQRSPPSEKDKERDRGDRKREHEHRDRHHDREDRDGKSSKRYRDNDRYDDDSKHDRDRYGHRSHKDSRSTHKESRRRDDRDHRHEKDHRKKDDYDRRDRRYKDDRSGDRRSSSHQKSSDDKYSDSRRPSSKDYDKRADKLQYRKRSTSRSRSHSRSKSPSHATKSVPVTEPLVSQRSPPSTSNNLNVAITNNPRMERIRNMKLERLEKLGIDISSQFGQQVPLATPPPSLLTIETTAPPGMVSSAPPTTTGITLPAYYNPAVINPTKYADQVQKRKLLWSAKKSEPVEATKWGNTKFSQDTEGKVASKFMRLMGIKNAPAPQEKSAESTPQAAAAGASSSGRPDTIKKQEELFSTMEQQYEVARQVTHTMRGVGLGFGTSRPF